MLPLWPLLTLQPLLRGLRPLWPLGPCFQVCVPGRLEAEQVAQEVHEEY